MRIVSATPFNNATKLPVILALTKGGAFASRIGFAVSISGTNTIGVVRCDQPRMIDLSACGGRMLDHLPRSILADVPARRRAIFNEAAKPFKQAPQV